MKHLRTPNPLRQKYGETRKRAALENWTKQRETARNFSDSSAKTKEYIAKKDEKKEIGLREISDILYAQPFNSVRETK